MNFLRLFSPLLLTIAVWGCNEKPATSAMFTEVSRSRSGIDFRNMLKEDENFNIFKYQYFNNGGGVAVGDFNNDGLQDLVFTGNMVKNRLYINQGDLKFEDHTQTSGIAAKEGWCTGVTTADVNADGW
ncbi:MAG: VCBS repeat-containing protein, partial [Bacteroidota bacterium]